jgi:F-type H+-transporting ATPase subunit b
VIAASVILASSGGGSILSPDASMIYILILFLLLVPILNRILFKPITHVLNERERLTEGASTDAHAMRNAIDHKLAHYEDGIRQARAEGYKLLEARRGVAIAERKKIIDQARDEAATHLANARATIVQEAETARTRLEDDARQLARRISSTVLGRTVGGVR